MEFTAIVQHGYPGRFKHLTDILASIRRADPKEIIVWNNTGMPASLFPWANELTVVQSGRNTLMGRYAAVLLAETEYVYVQDDDLVVDPETIREMVEKAATTPRFLVGVKGMRLSADSKAKPYTDGRAVNKHCQVVLGRAWACRRDALIPGMRYCLERNLNPGRCDDILFSMVLGGGFAIPNPKYTSLDEEGVGLCHEPQHYDERNAMASKLMSEGY